MMAESGFLHRSALAFGSVAAPERLPVCVGVWELTLGAATGTLLTRPGNKALTSSAIIDEPKAASDTVLSGGGE